MSDYTQRREAFFSNFLMNIKRTTLEYEFGYPETLTFDQFLRMYRRYAPATAVIERLIELSWVDLPVVVDGDLEKEATETTDWERTATLLIENFASKLRDADKRGLVGRYSAVLLQLRDGKTWDQPVEQGSLSKLGIEGLAKLHPVWENQLRVDTVDNDPLSETFGEPMMYSFINGEAEITAVHRDRVLLFAERAENDDPRSGTSFLEPLYNKILDLEKVSGGSAEGFLKNASRQLNVNFSDRVNANRLTQQAKDEGYDSLTDALNQKIKALNSGTDAAIITQEGTITPLGVAPGDPNPSWLVAANELSSAARIPFAVLFGQQTGRLASDQDAKDWANRGNARRRGFIREKIIDFLQRMVKFGVLPPPESNQISLTFTDLLAPSEQAKIANARELAVVAETTMRAYGSAAITPNEVRAVMELGALSEPVDPPFVEEPTNEDPQNTPTT